VKTVMICLHHTLTYMDPTASAWQPSLAPTEEKLNSAELTTRPPCRAVATFCGGE
jgi:hypothetical protein